MCVAGSSCCGLLSWAWRACVCAGALLLSGWRALLLAGGELLPGLEPAAHLPWPPVAPLLPRVFPVWLWFPVKVSPP